MKLPEQSNTIHESQVLQPPAWKTLSTDYRILVIILSLAYGGFLATLPLLDFKDRQNYLNYFLSGDTLYERSLADGLASFLSNEPVWLLISRTAHEYMDPELALRLLIGIPATVIAFVVLRFGPKDFLWLVIFLFMPLVITNHIIHLRQGLALSLFMIAYFLVNRTLIRVILFCLCPLIHSSFFFIILLLLISRILRAGRMKSSHAFLLILAACLFLAFSLPALLALTSARQALDDTSAGNSSGLGFLFWLGMLLLILNSGAKTVQKTAFPVTLLIFNLSTYFVFVYSGRVLESGVIIVLIALLSLRSSERKLAMAAIVFFFILTWVPRLSQPGFGWGL